MSRPVTIVGPVPPPRGGVSVHVMRLQALLQAYGHRVTVLPWSGFSKTSWWHKAASVVWQFVGLSLGLTRARNHTVHVHYATLPGFLVLLPWLYLVRARWALTLHSVRMLDDLGSAPSLIRRLALSALTRLDLIVCVRETIRTAVEALPIDGPETLLMPAFLPPAVDERDVGILPPDLAKAMAERRVAGVRQLACAASYLGPGYGHADLYGVELLAEDLAVIAETTRQKICLVIMVSLEPKGQAAMALARLQEVAASAPDLEIDFRIGCSLVPVLGLADVFVRPSREDGDSIAIREALAMGCPVLASDVVDRPDGVGTFPLDHADRRRAILAAILVGGKRRETTEPGTTYFSILVDALVGSGHSTPG